MSTQLCSDKMPKRNSRWKIDALRNYDDASHRRSGHGWSPGFRGWLQVWAALLCCSLDRLLQCHQLLLQQPIIFYFQHPHSLDIASGAGGCSRPQSRRLGACLPEFRRSPEFSLSQSQPVQVSGVDANGIQVTGRPGNSWCGPQVYSDLKKIYQDPKRSSQCWHC